MWVVDKAKSYGRGVLMCWLCFLGIAGCSEDDSGASAGIVGTWISRGLRTDVEATFDNHGRFIIVRIKMVRFPARGLIK